MMKLYPSILKRSIYPIQSRQITPLWNQFSTNHKSKKRIKPLLGHSRTQIVINDSCPKDHPLQPYIYNVLSELSNNGMIQMKPEATFAIGFLGTGGNLPGMHRNTSSSVLRVGGKSFVFDVGEGIQKSLCYSSIRVLDIEKIFITHMHADHVSGLLGLLLSIRTQSKTSMDDIKKRQKATSIHHLDIYGPPGLYDYIGSSLIRMYCKFQLSVTVHEFQDSKAEQSSTNHPNHQKSFTNYYPTLQQKSIYPKTKINPYWNISEYKAASDRDQRDRQFRINAVEIRHSRGVPTFAYILEEPAPHPPLDPDKALALGVNPGYKYSLLKSGQSVESDDDSKRIVTPEQVLCLDQVKRGRKMVLMGDNSGTSVGNALYHLGSNCDVLINECTSNNLDHRVSLFMYLFVCLFVFWMKENFCYSWTSMFVSLLRRHVYVVIPLLK